MDQPRIRELLSAMATDIVDEYRSTTPLAVRLSLIAFAAIVGLMLAFAPLPGAEALRVQLGLTQSEHYSSGQSSDSSKSFLARVNDYRRNKARTESRSRRH